MLSRKALLSVCTFAAALGLAVSATAQTSQAQMTTVPNLSVSPQSSAPIAQFVPQQQTRNTKLDYTILNDALNYSVLPLGQSTRRHMSRPDINTGSRIRKGHQSPYRLEGSRISFSLLNDEYKQGLHDYRIDLERIGNEIDLVRMNRSEQLAFWFNLHNIVMIDQIVQNYPVKRPSSIKVNGIKLDDAKIVNIKGQALSLRDIRERIVYPNWKNPNVIYGFFRGDIGSPALQDFAFTSQNVGATLATIGNEFVNALRGFNEGSKTRNVSRVYDEAKAFYFPNFESDLEKHLLRHAREEIQAEIRVNKPMKIDRYDEIVADLVGGSRPSIATAYVTDREGNQQEISIELANTLRELGNKRQVLKKRDLLLRGTVIIEDVDTSTPAYDPNVDPESSTFKVPPTSGL